MSLRRENGYQLAGHIPNGRLIDLELQRAVNSLTPALVIEPPFREDTNSSAAEPQTLREMYEISFRTKEDDVDKGVKARQMMPIVPPKRERVQQNPRGNLGGIKEAKLRE